MKSCNRKEEHLNERERENFYALPPSFHSLDCLNREIIQVEEEDG